MAAMSDGGQQLAHTLTLDTVICYSRYRSLYTSRNSGQLFRVLKKSENEKYHELL